ncbi:CheA signal transduction histidine kinase [Hyphomicrobium denitrificans ATCC 51888]|uniref:CheA signal transduction histidine kinase n=1 Tax=Hyphomicrobium denitrificans (strain ATCC 51888 / DSM 1869 / NCIMB 11706 / TK 0415) TaxID=582899 RepID=D8JVV1_HYPDA|nr:hypothetical protein [Hyphomicrobium denitrificans]ADJ22990.1 CheA signal transduction histidine kinase [Hyphomicrobium denitrificans ATCC 51888]
MSAVAHAIDRESIADQDPRNAVLGMLRTMLESAIAFAKSQDCEPQLLAIVKGLLPDLVPPPAADLFGEPFGKALPDLVSRAAAADDKLTDLFLTMVRNAPARLTQRRLTAAEHEAHKALAELANVLLELRKQTRK